MDVIKPSKCNKGYTNNGHRQTKNGSGLLIFTEN